MSAPNMTKCPRCGEEAAAGRWCTRCGLNLAIERSPATAPSINPEGLKHATPREDAGSRSSSYDARRDSNTATSQRRRARPLRFDKPARGHYRRRRLIAVLVCCVALSVLAGVLLLPDRGPHGVLGTSSVGPVTVGMDTQTVEPAFRPTRREGVSQLRWRSSASGRLDLVLLGRGRRISPSARHQTRRCHRLRFQHTAPRDPVGRHDRSLLLANFAAVWRQTQAPSGRHSDRGLGDSHALGERARYLSGANFSSRGWLHRVDIGRSLSGCG